MYLQLDKVLFTLFLLFASAMFWFIRRFIWPYRKIPSIFFDRKILTAFLKGEYPIVKYVENHLMNVFLCACKIFEKDGLCFTFYMTPLVLVYKEEYTKILLNGSATLNKSWLYKVLSEVLGNGLILLNGNAWKKRRKMVNPAFNMEMLKDYVLTFNRCARRTVDRFSMLVDQPRYDVLHITQATFLQAISEIVVGKEMNGVEHEKKCYEYDVSLTRLGRHTIYRSIRPWRYFKKFEFLFQTGRKHQKDYEICHNFINYLIEEAMKNNTLDTEDPRNEELERRSLAHILLQHHLNDPKSFTMEHLYDEINTLIVGAHDSVSHTAHWCLIMLSLHPEVQQKAFEEVESVLGSGDSDMTYEDFNNLKYLDSIIKETLRLYPTIPYFQRELSEDVQCGKYKIPKSTSVGFVLYLLHRDPDIYPDPNKFDPDRFYNKEMKHPWAFVPFAEGIRSCIGKSYAMLEMKVYLAHMLLNFKISLEDKDEDITPQWQVVLTPSRPVSFLFTRR